MKLIESNQMVGNGMGFFVIRDLYEKSDGSRVSVAKTTSIETAKERKTPLDTLLLKYGLK